MLVRLRIALVFGEIKIGLQHKVVSLAVAFLKTLKGEIEIKKDLASILAELKEKKQ